MFTTKAFQKRKREMKPLTLAISIAMTALIGGAVFSIANAAEPGNGNPPVEREARNFNIPAGPLSQVLSQFAGAAGVALSFDAGQLGNARSSGLKGTYTIEQGFDALLSGTGQRAVRQSNGDYVLRQEQANMLPPVKVSADAAENRQEYQIVSTPVQGNRLRQTVAETPRAISVVSRALLEDQQPLNEGDILRNVSSVKNWSPYQGVYSRFTLRGLFANNVGSYLRDGNPYVHLVDPLLFNLERVEVIKGPNAIDHGQSAPGGFINYVTKKPLDEVRYAANFTYGTDNLRKTSIDLSGPLNTNKSVLYRVTAGYEEDGSFTDRIEPRKQGIAGTLSWQVTGNTQVNISAEHNDTKAEADPGIPVPDPENINSADTVRVENFYGEPTGVFDLEQDFYSLEVVQEIADKWHIQALLSRTEFYRATPYIVHTGLTPDRQNTNRLYYWNPLYEIDHNLGRAELHGQFQTGPLEHRMLLGFDYLESETATIGYTTANLPPIPVYDPRPTGAPRPITPGATATGSKERERGIFIQDIISFNERWKLQWGLRRDVLNSGGEETSKVSPNLALSFEPNDNALIYTSYSRSFEPNWNVDLIGGGSADPSEGKQIELGVKHSWFDKRFSTSAAVFELEKTNIPIAAESDPTFQELAGKVRVRGLELEAAGEPLAGLQLTMQMTFLDPETVSDDDAEAVGNQPSRTVDSTSSLWARYRLPDRFWRWQVGGGIFHTGDMVLNDANTREIPAYTVADAFISYEVNRHLDLQVNIRNITDERYYVGGADNSDGYLYVYPGQPRSLTLTANILF